MNTLILKNIHKTFDHKSLSPILKDINQIFVQGHSYGIMGASGVGKSTLLHISAGLDHPSQGSILFNKTNINNMGTKEKDAFLYKHIGFIFQSPYLIKELSVLDNVLLKATMAKQNNQHTQQMAKELLCYVGLGQKIHSMPASLSGGQQQRVAVARALFGKPTFLLADEPTAHVDQQTKNDLLRLILDYQQLYSMGLIICSHDPEIIQKMNHYLVLKNGQLIKGSYETSNI